MADVTVKLAIGNFSLEVSGDAEYVNKKFEELINRFFSPRVTVSDEPGAPGAVFETAGKKTSPAEFLKRTTAKNQYDRAIVLGYYLERSQGVSGFTSGELGQLGVETKQPFANPSDAISKLTARGLMMSAGDKEGKRAYALTASGEAYVEGMLATNE